MGKKLEWIGVALFASVLMAVGASQNLLPEEELSATDWTVPHVYRDLEQVKHDTLRVLVLRDPLSWEERPGSQTGLEWDLLRRFAKKKKLPIKAVPVNDPDSMLIMLQNGEGDVAAAQLSPEGMWKDWVSFSRPYRSVAPVLIHLRPDPLVPATRHISANDTIHISRWSPFLKRSGTLFDTTDVVLVVDTMVPEELMAHVAIGKRAKAVISDASATLETKRLPQVEFGQQLGIQVPLAFAVRSNAPHLQHALDRWIGEPDEVAAREMIARSQSVMSPRGSMRSRFASVLRGDTISPFDSLFQVHADAFHWDWQLLAAVAYKESRFNTAATYKGAEGLMQLMPNTARSMGIDSAGGVDSHIRTATRYLAKLDTMFRRSIPDHDQRMRFVLASYNAGPGHVLDAQRLAKKLGLDPHRWDGNVERALTLLNRPRYFLLPEARTGFCHGDLTFWYVRDIAAAFHGARGRTEEHAALR